MQIVIYSGFKGTIRHALSLNKELTKKHMRTVVFPTHGYLVLIKAFKTLNNGIMICEFITLNVSDKHLPGTGSINNKGLPLKPKWEKTKLHEEHTVSPGEQHLPKK